MAVSKCSLTDSVHEWGKIRCQRCKLLYYAQSLYKFEIKRALYIMSPKSQRFVCPGYRSGSLWEMETKANQEVH